MEAGAVPRVGGPVMPTLSPRLLRLASDARLVGLVREGRGGAFETIYDRHNRGIFAFCRHMLSDSDEAEDAVQHTFMAAYTDLVTSEKPIHLRAWLFTIARNRCYTILRARREQPSAELEETAGEGLADAVQRRQDLRDLVNDMRRLPEDQRAALVLAELDALPHAEIAEVLDVPRDKVKALVFQARESLAASRAARDTACADIREQLSCGRGASLRRANLRRHLRECDGCRAFRAEVEHQRKSFAALIPIVPTLAVKELVLGATAVGTGAAIGGGVAAGALKGGIAKGFAAALLAGVGTAGTIVVTTTNVHFESIVNAISEGFGHAPKTLPSGATHHRHHAASHAHSATAAATVSGLALDPAAATNERAVVALSGTRTHAGAVHLRRHHRHHGTGGPALRRHHTARRVITPAQAPVAVSTPAPAPAPAVVPRTERGRGHGDHGNGNGNDQGNGRARAASGAAQGGNDQGNGNGHGNGNGNGNGHGHGNGNGHGGQGDAGGQPVTTGQDAQGGGGISRGGGDQGSGGGQSGGGDQGASSGQGGAGGQPSAGAPQAPSAPASGSASGQPSGGDQGNSPADASASGDSQSPGRVLANG